MWQRPHQNQIKAHLFLGIFDSQFQSGQLINVLIQQWVDVVTVIEDYFQLSGTTSLVQEVLCKLFTCTGQLFILWFKFILHRAELLQLPAKLKCREERILAWEGNEWRAGKGLVDV